MLGKSEKRKLPKMCCNLDLWGLTAPRGKAARCASGDPGVNKPSPLILMKFQNCWSTDAPF
jgi:hypothetical protein